MIEVKTLSHHQIEYPLEYNLHPIAEKGIYIPYSKCKKISKELKYNEELYIKCTLQLSLENEREKHNNPLLLSVDISSIDIYR